MSPETIAAISAVSAALVTAGPSYLAARRARGASQQAQDTAQGEGQATREAVHTALDVAVARIGGRLDGIRDELRTDIQEVRSWQTSHTAEHMLIDDHRRRNE